MLGVAALRANLAFQSQLKSLLCQASLNFSMVNRFLLSQPVASTLSQSRIKVKCIAGVKQSSANWESAVIARLELQR